MGNDSIQAVHFKRKTEKNLYPVDRFGPESAARARVFHQSFPEYQETPLAEPPACVNLNKCLKNQPSPLRYGFRYQKFQLTG